MPNFSINIVSKDPATFSPDPQNVPANSIVTWNNTTEDDHKLELSDGRVTDLIIAGQSSDEYAIDSAVTYVCVIREHEGENGSIGIVGVEDIPPC